MRNQVMIDKLALIHLADSKVLSTMSRGKDTWYLPGGKRERGESDEQTLTRETKEELNVELIPSSIKYYGTFKAQAHGKPEGVFVQMTCYTGKFNGVLKPSAEIEKFNYLGYHDDVKKSPVDYLIFDDLYRKGLIK